MTVIYGDSTYTFSDDDTVTVVGTDGTAAPCPETLPLPVARVLRAFRGRTG